MMWMMILDQICEIGCVRIEFDVRYVRLDLGYVKLHKTMRSFDFFENKHLEDIKSFLRHH